MSGFFGVPEGAQIVAQSTAGALIAGLWQSALLVAGVGVVLKVVPRTTAAARFAIWTAVFCVSAGMPVAGVLFGERTGAIAGVAAGHLQVDPRWSYLIAGVWLVAAVVRLAGLAVQGWKLRAVWMRAVPVPEDVLKAADCDGLLAEGRVRVCTSEDVDRPSVIGFFAPRILIPGWLFEQLSAVELRHIVLHEMEHLRRRDDWMNLAQKIGLVVFPLNPALLWVDRRLAAERELACDDGVLRRTQMPRAYAICLASIAEMRLERRMHRRVVALALGVLGAAGMLRGRPEFSRRIESILGRRTAVSPMLAGAVAAVLVVMVMGAGVGLAHAPQLVSFAPGVAAPAEEAVGRNARGEMMGGVRAQNVNFRVEAAGGASMEKTGVETRAMTLSLGQESVPQRLKPRGNGGVYGTAEAVPLSKTSARHDAVALTKQATGKTKRVKEQWVVLTSFDEGQGEEDVPARVVVRLDDGRFYLVPAVFHAAIPTPDGWLIVQL